LYITLILFYMKKSIIINARNEGSWTTKTISNFDKHFTDVDEIIGVDDGSYNKWVTKYHPKFKLITTSGAIGVARSRLLGVQSAIGDVVLISDGHVYYNSGDIDKAWELASKGYIVTSTTISMLSGKEHGCGRSHDTKTHSATNARAQEGDEAGLIGGVYFMRKDVAEEIICPSKSHGYNEQLMTYAALSLGHKIYCLPSFKFEHYYKKKFNYHVKHAEQTRNRNLIDWWFFDRRPPSNVDHLELDYKKFIDEYRVLSPSQLRTKMQQINDNLLRKKQS